MRRAALILMWMMVCASLWAQTTHRDSVLVQARYLKSIYRTDDALEALAALMPPGAPDEEVLAELADCHFQNGDYEKAADSYFLLSSLSPGNILYKIRRMQTFFRIKAWPQCIQAGHEVLQIDSIPAVLSIIGDCFRHTEQSDSALYYYRRSLAQKPLDKTVLSKAMGVLIDRQDYDGAIRQAESFLAEDPDNATIAPLAGLAHYRKGDYDSAQKVFQRQEDIGNDTYPVHFYLGQSYWHTNVTYEAERELLKAWALDSSDANLAVSIAAVKTEMYRPFDKQVKPMLEKAEAMIRPDSAMVSRIHQQYGASYYRLEQFDLAIPHYQEAYRYNPSFIQAISTIAYCYERLKKYKEALDYYERYLKLARPGSRGYEFAKKSIDYLKGEIFMNEP